jgi:hypothetical protein
VPVSQFIKTFQFQGSFVNRVNEYFIIVSQWNRTSIFGAMFQNQCPIEFALYLQNLAILNDINALLSTISNQNEI